MDIKYNDQSLLPKKIISPYYQAENFINDPFYYWTYFFELESIFST
jgi:hypothetical protein